MSSCPGSRDQCHRWECWQAPEETHRNAEAGRYLKRNDCWRSINQSMPPCHFTDWLGVSSTHRIYQDSKVLDLACCLLGAAWFKMRLLGCLGRATLLVVNLVSAQVNQFLQMCKSATGQDLTVQILYNMYRISSYSFRGNYSFLKLEIQRSQYIRPKVRVHKCAETI